MKRYLVPQGVQAQDLIAMTVHDLRTPVTAIKGFGQLALRQLDLPAAARPIRPVCDPALLERAVANLIRYALKYSSKGEPVLLATRLTPEGPAIVVSSECARDNGHHAGRSVNGRSGYEDPEMFVPGDL